MVIKKRIEYLQKEVLDEENKLKLKIIELNNFFNFKGDD